MNKKELEILNIINKDIQTLKIDFKDSDNKYYYNLVIGNLEDIIKGKYKK